MTLLVTPEEMRAAERAAVAAGVSEPELMRRAARGVADWVAAAVPHPAGRARRALALVGPGNNGGDALVALAELIANGWQCAALLVGRPSLGTLPANLELLATIELLTIEAAPDWRPDVVLDGIYGIGGRAQLGANVLRAIDIAHASRSSRQAVLVAIDTPSGVDSETGECAPGAFTADVTLTLGLPKIGLIREPAASQVGELVVIDIGIAAPDSNSQPFLLDREFVHSLVPRRAAAAHKTNTGAALIIGGAPAYFGAPRLAGGAAMRAGAGLVCVAAPAEVVSTIVTQVPEVTAIPLSGQPLDQCRQLESALSDQRDRYRAVVVGPGLGRDERASALCDWVFRPGNRHFQHCKFVLDADGLYWLAQAGDIASSLKHVKCVLTPHAGEMARLQKCTVEDVLADPLSVARAAALEWRQVVVLKLGYSVVATPDGLLRVAPRAMPELATAGTGDVLAGTIGGMLAQGLEPADAAYLAMYVGAMAGRAARADFGGIGVMAHDVIERLPAILRELSEPIWKRDWLRSLSNAVTN